MPGLDMASQSDNVAQSDAAFDSNPDPKSSGKQVDKDVSLSLTPEQVVGAIQARPVPFLWSTAYIVEQAWC